MVTNKILEEIKAIKSEQFSIKKSLNKLESQIWLGFDSFRRFAGVTFEQFVREVISRYLQERGILSSDQYLNSKKIDGEEIDLFCENPLIVGEVTSYAESADEALKLLKKAKLVERKYNKKPEKLYLIILSIPKKEAKKVREISEQNNIELILGKEI